MRLGFAKGEITSRGWRGPRPQRAASAPGFGVPQLPGPNRKSRLVADGVNTGGMTWSYQPSESSQTMTIAVSCQKRDFWIALMVSTTKPCSTSGLELDGW